MLRPKKRHPYHTFSFVGSGFIEAEEEENIQEAKKAGDFKEVLFLRLKKTTACRNSHAG